jgi:AcrR family transcriptional regulator
MGRTSLANERRAQILEAFYRCISKYGLQNSTIKRIAQEAGVQPSILYHYFRDRDQLLEKLLKKVLGDLTDSYISKTSGCVDSQTRFDKTIDFMYGPEMLNKKFANFFYNCIAEAQRKPRIRKSLRKSWQPGRDILSGLILEIGKASGLSAAQARDLGDVIFAIQDGLQLQRDIYGTRAPLKKMPQLIKDLVRTYASKAEGSPEFAVVGGNRRVDTFRYEERY